MDACPLKYQLIRNTQTLSYLKHLPSGFPTCFFYRVNLGLEVGMVADSDLSAGFGACVKSSRFNELESVVATWVYALFSNEEVIIIPLSVFGVVGRGLSFPFFRAGKAASYIFSLAWRSLARRLY